MCVSVYCFIFKTILTSIDVADSSYISIQNDTTVPSFLIDKKIAYNSIAL